VSAPGRRLVTAFVICYNHARFVVEALESVRTQDYADKELLVIDDCSTDNSVEVIRDWARRTGFPCRIVAHECNVGLVRTINEVVTLARGEFLATVTADDRWLPSRLSSHMDAFSRLPADCAVVYSDAAVIDEHGSRIAPSFIAIHLGEQPPPTGDIFENLLRGNFIPVVSTTVRAAAFKAVGPYDESLAYEDYDMWLRMSARFRFHFVPGAPAEYRRVRNSLSQVLANDAVRKKANAVSNFRMIEKATRSRALSSREAAIARDRLHALAAQVYRMDCDETLAIVREALRAGPSWRLAVTFAAASMGIRYASLLRLARPFRKRPSR
jgi:glycosyltransferase involved in cell wall biosynthesis